MMNTVTVPLVPFGKVSGEDDSWCLSCRLTVRSRRLELSYKLRGPNTEQLVIPDASQSPERRDELWQHTCFECFFGVQGESPYWELNVSPSGDWAFYRLEDYRKGLAPDPGVPENVEVTLGPMQVALHVELDLPRDIPDNATIEFSPTAVIEHKNGKMDYWARVHPGTEADFHDIRAFITIEHLNELHG